MKVNPYHFFSIVHEYQKHPDVFDILLKTMKIHNHIRPWLQHNINQILLVAILKKHTTVLLALLYILEKNVFSEKEIISTFKELCDCMIIRYKKCEVHLDYICYYKKSIDKDAWKSYLSD